MDGNKAFWEEFIQMYRSFSCLWDVKSKNYAGRNLRYAALEELTKKCKEVHPLATRDYVTKKSITSDVAFGENSRKLKPRQQLNAQRTTDMCQAYGILT